MTHSHHSTRLIMLLVVGGAAVVAFLSSTVLLWMGVQYMPMRYALASLAGYAVFLSLMNRWLGHQFRSSLLDRTSDVASPLDVSDALLRGGFKATKRTAETLFRGGRSGGGGASAAFDSGGAPLPVNPAPLLMSRSTGNSSSKGWSPDLDADGMLPVLAIIAIIAGVAACASVVWQAPQMLAELVADGAAAGAAYQGLRASRGDSTLGVIRRTWIPATVLTVTFVLLGFAGHYLKPGADSIGDFFR